jgi:hypothetical protein
MSTGFTYSNKLYYIKYKLSLARGDSQLITCDYTRQIMFSQAFQFMAWVIVLLIMWMGIVCFFFMYKDQLHVIHRMDQQNNNRKRKDLRQILKEPKLKHKNNPVVGRETDGTNVKRLARKPGQRHRLKTLAARTIPVTQLNQSNIFRLIPFSNETGITIGCLDFFKTINISFYSNNS